MKNIENKNKILELMTPKLMFSEILDLFEFTVLQTMTMRIQKIKEEDGLEFQIISIYAKGMTVRDISYRKMDCWRYPFSWLSSIYLFQTPPDESLKISKR